jgi:nucleotide-binding universal stress UspA family protein
MFMKNILVPVDFSQHSRHAFQFAAELAEQNGSSIHLLHVIELPVLNDTTLMPTLSFEQEYLNDAAEFAKKGFAKLIKTLKGAPIITSSIEYGTPTSTILDQLKRKKSDLLIMGTKGASGLKEYFVGSNTEKLVRLSPVPVISIPGPVKLKSIRNLIFPTSLQGHQDFVMPGIKQLQDLLKAKLHVVYINTPAIFRRDRESNELLQKFSEKYALKNFTLNIYNDISEDEGVIGFTSGMNNCMVAMATHGRSGIGHLMTGSIAEDIVNHIKTPVWTFRIGKLRK